MIRAGKKPFVKVKPANPKKTTAVAGLANRGLVIVITGNGKGKTTSAFGQALRAIGQGYKVFIMQFMKGRDYGEFVAAKKYLPRLTVRRSGLDSFVMRDKPAPVDVELARQGFELVKKVIASGKYNMVILDEINVAIDFNLIPLDEMIRLIKNKPPGLDLILTGRYAAKEIIKLADTVSEVKEIKHHYTAGIKDRAGIEY
ncbi:MAG TPA: cob(I)yrinic acid a,c-diamide adenosyltransferase [Smithellaceae bacterium]|nr:cob(I)yrinic acid a,c-diamide adenosyltransferase [Smithellaceae bacterium]HPE07928.1 cob(I)yrinic acid a,c-diamide adenosyltransferase [Smithellaceae bacterium]